MAEYPLYPNIMFGQSASWSSTSRQHGPRASPRNHFSHKTSFELPFPSQKLFLLARGPVGGSAKIVQSPNRTEDEGVVTVEVVAKYWHPSDLEFIRVSKISRDGNENGVGIFASQLPNPVNITFEITLYLPNVSFGRSSLYVKNLETDLPLFAHCTGSLADTVDFDTVSFKSSNMPIEVGSLYAKNAHVETSNSHIEGNFEISSSLKLLTANASIKAKIDLFNDEDAGETEVTMNTSNAPIDATLALISATSSFHTRYSEVGGKFKVSAATALSPIDITFVRAPVDSVLILDAFTSLSAATINLHETYEGTFSLVTTWNKPEVEVDNTARDPRSEGRKRTVNVKRDIVGSVAGNVLWGNGRGGMAARRGIVKVGTTLAPLALNL